MMRCSLLVLWLVTTTMSGCAIWRGPAELPPLPLLPPHELGYQGQVTQQVTIDWQGQRQQLLAAWAVTDQRLDFVGLTANGQRLLTLGYDGNTFTESYSDLLAEPLPGREVLAHVQLAHWPQASIQRALKASSWRMTFAGQQRQLFLDNRLVLTIATEARGKAGAEENKMPQPPARIRVVSELADYQLTINTL